MRKAVRRIEKYFDAHPSRPAAKKAIARMDRELRAPAGLLEWLGFHDGFQTLPRLYSASQIERWYATLFARDRDLRKLIPFCGFDRFEFACVVRRGEPGEGAVIRVSLESADTLIGSSIPVFLELLAERIAAVFTPSGAWRRRYGERGELWPWPGNEHWLRERDPDSRQLLDDPALRQLLVPASRKHPLLGGFSLHARFGSVAEVLETLTARKPIAQRPRYDLPQELRQLVAKQPDAAAELFRCQALRAAKRFLEFHAFPHLRPRAADSKQVARCRSLPTMDRWLRRIPAASSLRDVLEGKQR